MTPSRTATTARALAVASAFLAGVVGATAQQLPPDPDLTVMLRYMVEDSVTPGAVLGVLEADGTTRVVSYGSAGPGARPLDARSVFEIGSITKTFTATVLADMVLAGEMALDDPVARYLPGSVGVPSRGGREVTLRDLATHRSGLPSMGHRPENIYAPYAGFTVDSLYAFLDTAELRSIPGQRYRYSNLGFSLLAHAMGRAAGMPYPQLLRERVLEPLGMGHTGYVPEGELAALAVWGHDHRGVLQYFEPRGEAALGAGGLYSNAPDLLKYLAAQVGPPGSRLQRAMAMTREIQGETTDRQYGLGWIAWPLGRRFLYFHGGGTRGFSAVAAFDPERDIATVVLTNLAGLNPMLGTSLMAPDPVPAGWEVVDVEREVLERYTGRYERDDGQMSYFIRLDSDGALTYQPPGRPRARLYPTSDTTFFMKRGPWSLTFRPDGGPVTMVMATDQREPAQSMVHRARRVAGVTPSPVEVAGGSWHEPEEGPGLAGMLGLAALVAAVLWFGMIRPRRRMRSG